MFERKFFMLYTKQTKNINYFDFYSLIVKTKQKITYIISTYILEL